jgi:hypothetical protein
MTIGPFQLIEVALGSQGLPNLDSDELKRLQHKLWDDKIPLNPSTFYPWPTDKPRQLNQQKWREFKNLFSNEQSQVLEKMMNTLDCITYGELNKALFSLVQTFNDQITDHYSIGVNINKSSHWLASLAVPFLKHHPKDAFEPHVDTMRGTPHPNLKKSENAATKHLVLFDDVAYSGRQLSRLVDDILKRSQNLCITVLVAFSSERARKLIENTVRSHKNNKTNSIVLITTDRKLRSLKEAISFDEMSKLELKGINVSTSGKAQGNYSLLTLSYPAWKIPDTDSFLDFLIIAKETFGVISGLPGQGRTAHVDCSASDVYCFYDQPITPYKNINIKR